MNNYPTKFCINCNSYDAKNQICGEDRSIRHVNPVSGHTMYERAVVMRADATMCGMNAAWFTDKILEDRPWYRRLS